MTLHADLAPSREPVTTDWQSIAVAYRADVLSVREIAASHGVTHPAILKRVKRAHSPEHPEHEMWARSPFANARVPAEAGVAKTVVASAVATAPAPAVTKSAVTAPVTAEKPASAAERFTAPVPPTPKGSNTMQFRCPDPEHPIHLALTSGHTALVGPEFAELPAMFHHHAVLAGCEISGTVPAELRRVAMVAEAERLDREQQAEYRRAAGDRDPRWLEKHLASR